MRTVHLLFIALLFAAIHSAVGQPEWLDKVDESLYVASPNGFFRSDLSGLLDAEGYYIDGNPPGLLFDNDDFLFNPRLSLFLDTRLGNHLYSFVQVRFDRGFDPGSKPDGDARFDEYILRYTPFDDARVNFQIGKFATVFGNWVARHHSWDNPLITAPLPYENVIAMSDITPPPHPGAFLARRDRPDQKATWMPVIWGPSYASGASVFGSVERFDYAAEIKNASLSSRPEVWDATDLGWEYPVFTGRVGYRPNAAWNIGFSGSHGSYILPDAEPALPRGRSFGDYKQTTIGADLSYAWHHLQIWGEAMMSRFDVPNVGDADTYLYYVEAKYKWTPRVFTALRWNQQFFDKVRDSLGGEERWDRNIWRIDTALGYRFNRHLLAKLQYSYNHESWGPQQGEQLVAGQITVKF